MTREVDKDGKLPMSGKEYLDFQRVVAVGDTYERCMERLEYRASISPDPLTLRRMRTVKTMIPLIYESLFRTIPVKKQRIVQHELQNAVVRIEIGNQVGLPDHQHTEFTTVPVDSLEWLINQVLQWECLCCAKEGKETKTCPLRKRLESMYLFELEDLKKGECPFATMTSYNIRTENA